MAHIQFYELIADKICVGFEIEFIPEDTKHSFATKVNKDLPALRESAARGDAESQYKLGEHFYAAKEPDYDEALKWFQLAATQNQAEAIYRIGVCHHFGRGVPSDEVKARVYFESGASLGEAASMVDLAIYLTRGMGGPRDDAKAVDLLHRAADQNEPRAELLLGIRYLKGNGVPKNAERAAELRSKTPRQKTIRPACYLIGIFYANR